MKTLNLFFPFGALALTACAGTSQKEKVEKPNILLIYADDIGYGDLSCNGTSAVRTPNVEQLAAEGIRFTNAHCAAATSTPSRYSLLTGQYAWRRQGTGIAAGNAAMVVTPERYTLPDMFREAGYTTAVVGKWHLGLGDKAGEQDWNGLITPNASDIGFDYSYIMAATADRTPCMFVENGYGVGLDPNDPIYVSYKKNYEGEPTGKDNPELLRVHPSHGHDQAIVNGISRIGFMKGGKSAMWRDEDIADSITVHAIRFIEETAAQEKPFFLYLATNDIHVPRVPHERFAGKSGLGPRGDALLSFDYTVGEVMKTLKRLGLDENTIIILSSDNGAVIDDGYKDQAVELLGEHKATGIYRGGKYSIYEGGTRVPCILRWKGRVEPGVSDHLMSHVDWFRSFANMLGVEIPAHGAPDSEDYMESWLNADKAGRKVLVEQNLQNNVAIIEGEWKYIPAANGAFYNHNTDIEMGNMPDTDQLYNLATDPGEKKNVAADNEAVVKNLRAKLLKVIESGEHYRTLK